MKIIIEDIYSRVLERKIRVNVALPAYYDSARRYPVLYMHDGQNVFDLRRHPLHDWNVNHIADELELSWIIVTADSPERTLPRFDLYYPREISNLDFYLPSKKWQKGTAGGGKAHLYADFLVHELIPKIEREYSVQPLRAMAGASLGAAVSLYIADKYPLFTYLGLLSPAIWFDKEPFLDFLRGADYKGVHAYVSIGSNETSDENIPDFPQIYMSQAQIIMQILQEKTESAVWHIEEGGEHDGRGWSRSMKIFMNTYLVPHQASEQK